MNKLVKIILGLMFLIVFTNAIQAQVLQNIQNIVQPTEKAYMRYKFMDALDYADFGNWDMALRTFMVLDTTYKNNGNIKYNIGVCMLNANGDKLKALPYLEEAAKRVSINHTGDYLDTTAAMDTYFFLGKLYALDMQFDKAIDWFNKYRYFITKYYSPEFYTDQSKDGMLFEIDRQIEVCYNAKKLIANPLNVKTENLGPAVNSEYDDYSPVLSGDGKTMFFTSRKLGSTGGMVDDLGKYFEDIYVSQYNDIKGYWEPSKSIGTNINTNTHEATTSLSHDGKTLMLYHDENANGNVFYCEFKDDVWSSPISFGPYINKPSWETHACLSPNNSTLYFVSDRKGGYGGRDIWASERLANGTWAEPQNLGPKINTEYDEEAPFILNDGVTLFFASQGHESMGGYDIFMSTLHTGVWTDPENMGYPINTPDDDIFLFPLNDGKTYYYSSKARGGYGGQDIYKMTVIQPLKEFCTLRGIVFDAASYKPLSGRIEIKDAETGRVISMATSRQINGEYHIMLPISKKYTITVTADNYETYTETFKITKEVQINKAILLKLLPPFDPKAVPGKSK